MVISSASLGGVGVMRAVNSSNNQVIVQAAAAVSLPDNGAVVIRADSGATAARIGGWTYVTAGWLERCTGYAQRRSGTHSERGQSGQHGCGCCVDSIASAVPAGGSTGGCSAGYECQRCCRDDVVLTANTGATVISTGGWTFVALQLSVGLRLLRVRWIHG